MNCAGFERGVVYHITLSKFLVSIPLNFLASTGNNQSPTAWYSGRLAASLSSIPVLITICVVLEIRELGFLSVPSRADSGLCLSLIAFNRSSEINRSSAPTPHMYLPYDWKTANVPDVPAHPLSIKRRRDRVWLSTDAIQAVTALFSVPSFKTFDEKDPPNWELQCVPP